jgi:hypothetical protein
VKKEIIGSSREKGVNQMNNVFTQNLIRAHTGGYGGTTRPDPYTIHSQLLAQNSAALASKKQAAQLKLAEDAARRNQEQFDIELAKYGFESGMGTPEERLGFAGKLGYSELPYWLENPGSGSFGGYGTSSSGGRSRPSLGTDLTALVQSAKTAGNMGDDALRQSIIDKMNDIIPGSASAADLTSLQTLLPAMENLDLGGTSYLVREELNRLLRGA